LDTDGRKRSRSGEGWMNLKRKITFLSCAAGLAVPAVERYIQGGRQNKQAHQCVYTQQRMGGWGWIARGPKLAQCPGLSSVSLYTTRDFWLVCPESPPLSPGIPAGGKGEKCQWLGRGWDHERRRHIVAYIYFSCKKPFHFTGTLFGLLCNNNKKFCDFFLFFPPAPLIYFNHFST
jgi:hypothetical protein